jgi:hypothetical protein
VSRRDADDPARLAQLSGRCWPASGGTKHQAVREPIFDIELSMEGLLADFESSGSNMFDAIRWKWPRQRTIDE